MAESEEKIIGYLIDRTQKKLKLSLTRKLQEIGAQITVEQWVILDRLNKQDGIMQYEIADGTFKDPPNVSRIVNHLCDKGLTKRVMDPKDRRRFRIFLTPKGRETIELALPTVQAIRQKSWEGLNDNDYQQLVQILNRVFENLDE